MQRNSPATPVTADDVSNLWREHRHWVAAVLHAHRPRRAGAPDLDDLLQEVAMVLVRKKDELPHIEAIEPWLRTVAVNIARDAGRRVTAAGKVDRTELASRHNGQMEPSSDAATRARTALEIAEHLPMTYGEPLLLSLRGLSYRQISRALDLPESTIQNRLFRARAMVRSEIESCQSPPLRLADPGRSETHG